MTRLLFVDDEPHILEGLKRMMRRVRDQWEVRTANSGADALAVMAEWPADVVVSDMRMPHMNGVELLNRIAAEYPEAVRLILSGHTDREVIMQSAIVAHQFLAKPCSADVMVNTLHRAKTVRELLGNPAIRDIVGRTMQLPCLSSTYAELMKVLGREGSTIHDVAEVVSRDLVLTARVMQLVNSSFFSNARRIDSIEDAVAFLGLDVVRGLVAAVKAFDGFENVFDEKSLIELFHHCLEVGAVCRQIAISESMTIRDQEDALLAGMLHDIGKLVLSQAYPDSYEAILSGSEDWWPNDQLACKNARVSHAEVGGYLLGLWGFQNHIVEAVAYHERPRAAPVMVFSLATILHVANARAIGRPDLIDREYLAVVGKKDAYDKWGNPPETTLPLDCRVLFVDDEPNLLAALVRTLRKDFEVVTACGAEQGMACLEHGNFDAVIADMQMPLMDGITFLKNVRQVQPSAVRIMLTGNADHATLQRAIMEAEIARFLSKPCSPESLRDAILETLGRHQAA